MGVPGLRKSEAFWIRLNGECEERITRMVVCSKIIQAMIYIVLHRLFSRKGLCDTLTQLLLPQRFSLSSSPCCLVADLFFPSVAAKPLLCLVVPTNPKPPGSIALWLVLTQHVYLEAKRNGDHILGGVKRYALTFVLTASINIAWP